MYLAERSGNQLYVVVQQATWETPAVEEPEPEEPEPEEQTIIITCADRYECVGGCVSVLHVYTFSVTYARSFFSLICKTICTSD
jgi:hypothetical protein